MYRKTDKTKLAENLKELRETHGYTQQALADILNIKRTAYAKMETGVTYGSLETLAKISGLFGISIETLLGIEENSMRVRIHDHDIKKFNKVCKDIGISPEAAIKMFVQTVIRQQKIPFELSADNAIE